VEVDGVQVQIMFDQLPQPEPGQVVVIQDGHAVAPFDVVPQTTSGSVEPLTDFLAQPADEASDTSMSWADGPWPKHKVCCEEWLG
jgi:hypothetical protein